MRFISIAVLTLTILAAAPAGAQDSPCKPGRDLLPIPEIPSKNGRLQGVVLLTDEPRHLAEAAAGTGCEEPQQLRYFEGYSTQEPRREWPHRGEPLPGPTLRARVGDLVQLTFLNQIDTNKFTASLDQGIQGDFDGCDWFQAQRTKDGESALIYPHMTAPEAGDDPGDVYPNCIHGSSTANLHFHGTHTTPSTTGDNVLLFIRPALREGGKLLPEDAFVEEQFSEVFDRCAANGPPETWDQIPEAWRNEQKKLLEHYDATAPYKGEIGLPPTMKLWPKNADRIAHGLWPQYSIGAYPYCFPLPAYDPADPEKFRMGQAPGTHWYHAHKHGSTALNVGNGMAGAFVIEGEYDDALRRFYRKTPQHKNWGLEERVLVIQQLEGSLNVLSPGGVPQGPNGLGDVAPLSVNGRLNPVVTMKPNQVQLWRIVNTAHRSFVSFHSFTTKGPGGQRPAWRQIAQDGVQFAFANYQRIGKENARFNLATANRADLLVRAPAHEGDYELLVVESVVDVPDDTPTATLLTVKVEADENPIEPPMDFIVNEEDFPPFPAFLADIDGPFYLQRELHFNTVPGPARRGVGRMPYHKINNELFDGEEVDQTMYLDTAEEWRVVNETVGIAHPFHIHINPFQIVEFFQPNAPEAKDPNNPCYADPLKPATWRQCHPPEPPYVWWDVSAIPTARADKLTVCTELDQCPAAIREFTTCDDGKCTVTIPGFFRMRSRFVDFAGQYVLHCHILAHEDRGMMQLIETVEKPKQKYEHH